MGSFHMVEGFFADQPADGLLGQSGDSRLPVANRTFPGKRPRSTMAPTLVFRGNAPGDLVMATGSGGGAIIFSMH